ncbi:GMP synthase-like glutamine amidotransferase [Geodermatophilus bullaregiensis]|uniref:type 1 glutamine amidotransferase n=1 Tax=Geodermatophilus bullaregiensis TaxID=1564160 RepID=UPI001957765C|nr:type 1 glutamine amidotransferase [Geodermatophilus bullaregiensis]MBM7804912.1 GMP synthase-like glutamine amidotransferase [Geodermatophilus bullaregiensis]
MPDRPRLLVVVPSDTAPPARLGEWLTAAGLELDERHLDAGDAVPADLADHDGLLVTGGPQSSLDDNATSGLGPVRALLARALADDAPTLAVCLGAQLMAQAGGGRVRVGSEGPEVGAALVARRDAAERDPLFAPVPLSPDVVQWHHDEISQLPPGATLLASSPLYVHQAFRVGRACYALQFHVETSPDVVRRWAQDDPVGVAATPFDAATVAERAAAVHPDVEEVWAPFAGRFADLVRAARTTRV